MVKFGDINDLFLDKFDWKKVFYIKSELCLSPDNSEFKRVFCADNKIRSSGRYLYGTIGIFHEKNKEKFGYKLPFSSYITNFGEFSYPDSLDNIFIAEKYVRSIIIIVEKLLKNIDELICFYKNGKFNSLDLYKFLDSSSESEMYIQDIFKLN
jgi:hypothetical protein